MLKTLRQWMEQHDDARQAGEREDVARGRAMRRGSSSNSSCNGTRRTASGKESGATSRRWPGGVSSRSTRSGFRKKRTASGDRERQEQEQRRLEQDR
jgi:hypothetical protein